MTVEGPQEGVDGTQGPLRVPSTSFWIKIQGPFCCIPYSTLQDELTGYLRVLDKKTRKEKIFADSFDRGRQWWSSAVRTCTEGCEGDGTNICKDV